MSPLGQDLDIPDVFVPLTSYCASLGSIIIQYIHIMYVCLYLHKSLSAFAMIEQQTAKIRTQGVSLIHTKCQARPL